MSFGTSEGNQLSYFQNLRFRPIKHLKMTVWTSALWKMNIQLAKIWPEMVKILKYWIVIWIESEYSNYLKDLSIKSCFTFPVTFSLLPLISELKKVFLGTKKNYRKHTMSLFEKSTKNAQKDIMEKSWNKPRCYFHFWNKTIFWLWSFVLCTYVPFF